MNHFEAQSYIIPFIEGKLPEHVKEDFVIHMKNCADCHEELEINYMLLVGMRQLNDEKAISNDFQKDLEQELNRMKHKVHGKQRMRFSAFSICMAAIILVSAFFYGIGLNGVYAYEQDIRKANQGPSYYSNAFGKTFFPELRDRRQEKERIDQEENKEMSTLEKIKRVRVYQEKRRMYEHVIPSSGSMFKNDSSQTGDKENQEDKSKTDDKNKPGDENKNNNQVNTEDKNVKQDDTKNTNENKDKQP